MRFQEDVSNAQFAGSSEAQAASTEDTFAAGSAMPIEAPAVTTFGNQSVEENSVPELTGVADRRNYTIEPSREESHHIMWARWVSWFSICVSLFIGGTGIAISMQDGALAILGLGGETLLDSISSVLVLWRFKEPKRRSFEDAEEAGRRKEERAAKRERRSSFSIGICFIAFAVFLLLISIVHMLSPPTAHDHEKIELEEKGAVSTTEVAWPAFFVFTLMAWKKMQLSKKLQSMVLRQDAVCTAFGALLSLITGLSAALESLLDSWGWDETAFGLVDPMASGFIAVLILGEGARTVTHSLHVTTDSVSESRAFRDAV